METEPLMDEAELSIWGAFQRASESGTPLTTTPGSTFSGSLSHDLREAEEGDRPQKWPRSDGKGNARAVQAQTAVGKRAFGAGGGGRSRRGGETSWGDSWNKWQSHQRDDDDVTAMLRAKIDLLTRLILRHEDSINIWRAECSYVMFVRTGIPGSLVPSLFAAKDEWQRLRKDTPEKVKSPLRCVLLFVFGGGAAQEIAAVTV